MDHRFPNHVELGAWIFNHDDGWNLSNQTWYKGYCYPDLGHGNYCGIRQSDNRIYIEHDRDRSFPLFWNDHDHTLSNCMLPDAQQLYCDDQVYLDHDSICIQKNDVIGTTDLPSLTESQVVDAIDRNLTLKFQQLARSDLPLRLFVSGGIDTLCLWYYAKSHDINCEILDYEYFAYDHFTNHFIKHIRQHCWAYNQLHHWTQPTMLLSGACGDEFTFRGPATIAIWAAWHDIDFADIIEKNTGYHQHYFLLEKNSKIFKDQYAHRHHIKELCPTKQHLIRHLIDINLNDHQHWHLGHTMTWTPFKDIEIFKLMLSLDPDHLIAQFIDASVTRQLIPPEYQRRLSSLKNYHARSNLLT